MTSLKCVNIAIEHFETFNTTFHYGTVPNAATTGETGRKHGRGKTYLGSRIPHSTKEMSCAKGTVSKAATIGETGRKYGCGKMYLASIIPHSNKETSCLQLRRIALSGDIQINAGPVGKRVPKYPCKECNKNVRNNQDALLCAVCNS